MGDKAWVGVFRRGDPREQGMWILAGRERGEVGMVGGEEQGGGLRWPGSLLPDCHHALPERRIQLPSEANQSHHSIRAPTTSPRITVYPQALLSQCT